MQDSSWGSENQSNYGNVHGKGNAQETSTGKEDSTGS